RLREMDARVFAEGVMGLVEAGGRPLGDRLSYQAEKNLVFADFEGLHLDTPEQVAELSAELDEFFGTIGRRVNVVVNYDDFFVAPVAEEPYWEMVRSNTERWFLSAVRYSHQAFLRRRTAAGFGKADTRLHGSLAEAMQR